MRAIGLGSVRGAPGVTTTALLLTDAIGDQAVLVEADVHGGVLAVRFGLGREPGLSTFAAAASSPQMDWRDHAQSAGGTPVIVGPEGADRARSLWRQADARIAAGLDAAGVTVIADLGRIGDDVPLSGHLAVLAVLARPTAEHLVTLSDRLPSLRRHARHVGVILVGEGEYCLGDVTDSLGLEVLGSLPDDPRTASLFASGRRSPKLERSPLLRSIKATAGKVEGALASVGPSGLVGS